MTTRTALATKTTLWVGPFDYDERAYGLGDRAFLIRRSHPKMADQYELSSTPPRTNQSGEYRLFGWCGSYNDMSTTGEGAVEVVKIAQNGRLQVQWLDGDKLSAMLHEFGFPELD